MSGPERTTAHIAAAFMTVLLSAPALADDFYEGKTITMLIGTSAGGGYDTYSRTIARHLPKYIPGTPNVVPRNQPGAGSAAAASVLANTAPKDGTWIGAIFPGVIIEPILDPKPKSLFDPRKFVYLASANNSVRLCVTGASSKVKTFAGAQNLKTIVGDGVGGGSTRDYANMMKHTAGAKFDLVSGYPGTSEIFLAIERGEVDGVCGLDWSSLKAQRPDWIKEKKVHILVQMALEKHAELDQAGVPSMWDFIKEKGDVEAAELVVSQQVFGRPYIAPPGTPAEQVRILRSAFAKTFADKSFLADAKKAGLDVDPSTGEEVQKIVDRVYASPAATIDRAKRIIRQ